MKPTIIIGIDPGMSGGIATVNIETGITGAIKMPETPRDIWDALGGWVHFPAGYVRAAIEKVHSMPKQGVTSSFTFGKGYGALLMALIAANIPFVDVTPQKWQKSLSCMTGGDKNVSKARAQQLFPTLKITHAVADALLIAEWLRTQP